ncbi:Xaa-Pro aminopeptidase [Mycobacterium sp. ACS1612]|uniref:M24 family metallopeptidase n=1 Tax=Mycobacterium sp. ACS1612 TaxID=1834117 RepID=UPI0007FF60D8|nr:M24 family metallopeptidase [Mycobacterium sp. ACS1612]OBF27555.1 Xaa-Pro aminopeptidase [Mycobacterium sp. ACS1612]
MATEIVPDERALRIGRRERAFAQMEAHDLDVLVLGRQANVRYFSGAPQLWVAGTRPFGPICTVVRSSRDIHLNSTWDEGMPDDIPHENLYGLAWNPMTLIEVLKAIPGASTARRVGTDALTPSFAKLLPLAFPNAEFVDGELAMRTARRIKTPEEVIALRGALQIAEESLAAAVGAVAVGATAKDLTAILLEAQAAGGVSTPATQEGVWITSRRAGGRIQSGDLVAFSAGVLRDGYVGEVGRTWPVGEVDPSALYDRWNALWDRLAAACQPGRPAVDLLKAYEDAGEPLPPMPVAHGLGLGFDPPVVVPPLRATATQEILDPGMVLSVTGYVWQDGLGAVFGREAVLIAPDGPELLTSSPSWGDRASAAVS